MEKGTFEKDVKAMRVGSLVHVSGENVCYERGNPTKGQDRRDASWLQ